MLLAKYSSSVTLGSLKKAAAQILAVRQQQSGCGPANPCPPTPSYPPCPPNPNQDPPVTPTYPPYFCCPRTKYDVRFVYINDTPPKTTVKDFFDRASQTIFWTELVRGQLSSHTQ